MVYHCAVNKGFQSPPPQLQNESGCDTAEAELKKRKLSRVKLTGQSQQRDALIEQFTSGQVPLFLISLKAGG